MFDYDPEGRRIVMADGDELLVHDGGTEGPLWRHTERARLVGAASTKGAVISLDERGRLVWRDPSSGAELDAVEVGGPARALAATEEGHCAVALSDEVALARRGVVWRRIEVAAPTCLAWSPDGGLGVGTADGAVHHFADGDDPEFSTTLDGSVGCLAWNAEGFWLAGVGHELFRFDPEQTTRVTGGPEDMPIRSVHCTPRGDYLAALLGDDLVLVLAYPSRDTDAQLRYMDRTASGVRFGPHPWLGVGLVGGDGNKLDLVSGALHRTDTQPGRQHNSWMVSVSAGRDEEPEAAAPAEVTQAPPPSTRDTILGIVILAVIGVALWFALS